GLASRALGAALAGLDALPVLRDLRRGEILARAGGALQRPGGKDMRVATQQFAADLVHDVSKIEATALLSRARQEHDLEQQITESVGELRPVFALDGIDDLVGFLDGV